MQSISIFANPISGKGRGERIARKLNDAISSAGYDTKLFLERADQLTPEHLDPNASAIIMIGGDGTLRAVADRLYRADDDSPKPPILIVPMGTANLMGKHLGIKWHKLRFEEQVLRALRHHDIVQIDTASANGELMLLVAGVGLDGTIVHELTRRRRGPISYFSYAMPAISALQNFDYPPLTVTVDDQQVFGPLPGLVFVANIAEYGIGLPILPDADPTDGKLDVCAMPCSCPEELASLVLQVASGEHIHGDGVVCLTGRSVRVDSPQAVPVQVDGEAAGTTPLAIDLLSLRLPFIVPKK